MGGSQAGRKNKKETFMARGKRTDPIQAEIVKILAEMGFEPGLISSMTGIARGTVKDISERKGRWAAMQHNELTARIRSQMIAVIDSLVYGLAMKAMAKLDEEMKTASYLELVSVANVLVTGQLARPER
jgi:hypothetical protein